MVYNFMRTILNIWPHLKPYGRPTRLPAADPTEYFCGSSTAPSVLLWLDTKVAFFLSLLLHCPKRKDCSLPTLRRFCWLAEWPFVSCRGWMGTSSLFLRGATALLSLSCLVHSSTILVLYRLIYVNSISSIDNLLHAFVKDICKFL